ncbi:MULTISPECIES: ribosome assembly RNA-binding protein YhbY [unclassified Granulicatella]|uniref:ribosome assembly RNA-binding protein YhbY n=1 Tax=unclassified Granulicatella TaxID=2630493 RepID=UPI00107439DA|nr:MULTISPECIES: ribosome assembly RNA-binding protein YhbY [unclassified Granulicatella]MBF0780797.1 ribosome assembly RNA-binding protein YhbY [Granulicatella sp. 19428wC4_WM01]TFU93813.1 ribosome assembly RNA-binding protein YhbY [Granulicatella sp. WM01]
MLSTKQIKFLKKEAHHLKPIFQIGKGGVNEEMLVQINQALEKRELIKITLLQNTMEDTEHVASILTQQLHIIVVQIIGHTLVLYKQSSTPKYRHISEKVKNI